MQDPSLYGQMNPIFPEPEHLKCPRCDSPNTKFCYYNNYNLSQPRHFCKSCKRYWTKGGVLRNIPVGGGTRKTSKRSSTTTKRSSTPPSSSSTAPSANNSSSVTSADSSKAEDYQISGAAFDHGRGMVGGGGGGSGGDGGGHFGNFTGLSQTGSNLQLGEFVNSCHNPGSGSNDGNFSALLGSGDGRQFGNTINGLTQNELNLQLCEFGNSSQNLRLGPGSGMGEARNFNNSNRNSGSSSSSNEGKISTRMGGATNGSQIGNFINVLSQNESNLQLGEFGNSSQDLGSVSGSGSGSGPHLVEGRNFDLQMGLLDGGGDNNDRGWSGDNSWPDLAI